MKFPRSKYFEPFVASGLVIFFILCFLPDTVVEKAMFLTTIFGFPVGLFLFYTNIHLNYFNQSRRIVDDITLNLDIKKQAALSILQDLDRKLIIEIYYLNRFSPETNGPELENLHQRVTFFRDLCGTKSTGNDQQPICLDYPTRMHLTLEWSKFLNDLDALCAVANEFDEELSMETRPFIRLCLPNIKKIVCNIVSSDNKFVEREPNLDGQIQTQEGDKEFTKTTSEISNIYKYCENQVKKNEKLDNLKHWCGIGVADMKSEQLEELAVQLSAKSNAAQSRPPEQSAGLEV